MTLQTFLADRKYEVEEFYQWGESELQVHAYLSDTPPPDKYITSARCIIQQDKTILVVFDPNDSFYIIPGGRREAGETVDETLTRELLEEVGWTVKNLKLVGFTHFHHLTAKPQDYPYPYPDFCQVIFAGETDTEYADKKIFDQFVTGFEFRPKTEVLASDITDIETLLLKAALRP